MSCRVEADDRYRYRGGGVSISERRDSLRNCGCRRCYEEHERLGEIRQRTNHSHITYEWLEEIREQIARSFHIPYRDLYKDMSDAVMYGVGMSATEARQREVEKSAILGMAYGRSPAMIDGLPELKTLNSMTEALMNTTTAALPVKPITNPAIKLLADRLATVVSNGKSAQSSVDLFVAVGLDKGYVKTYSDKVKDADTEAAALRKALKKLGHKIEG